MSFSPINHHKIFVLIAKAINMKFNSGRKNSLLQSDSLLWRVGIVASSLAAVSTPIADAVNLLHFVLGYYITVSFPSFFGLIAILVGTQLYRLNSGERAIFVIVLGVLGTTIGIFYGITVVL